MPNENRRLKIAFLNTLILQDKKTSWKITNEYIAQALQKHCGDITYIDPPQLRVLLAGKIINKSAQLLLKKSFMYYHSFLVARGYAKSMTPRLAGSDFDVIFAPSCATEIAYLETDIPIVLIEDANFALLHDYYAQYSNLLKRSFYEVDTLESLALHRTSLALYPSEWASRATREHYSVDAQKVHTVPFGANIDHPPSIEVVQRRKKSERCKLFFLGVDWERKGGAIAFETLLKLEELGISAELTVCGCIPPDRFSHQRMTVIPFLSRKDEEQRRRLESLFETSDFLLLPTRGETYGMVFCEASSFGLPSITTDTGGVAGAVTNGENGYILPQSAQGAEYAELIAKIYCDDQGYAALVKSSRAAFENRLNWDAWGISVTKLVRDLLARRNLQSASSLPGASAETIGSAS